MAPRTSYPLPAQHPFGGMDAWRLLSLRAAASPEAPFLTWHPYSLLPTIWCGGRAVLLPKWSTSRFWDVPLRYGCTWTSLMGLSMRAVLGIEAHKRINDCG
ncbi:MAG TPA: hypothetical protein VFV73_40810 [Streptosporangiaceae bacterium]|nr:hypothetical protein [Streptosporangiaceae bacterium]